MSAFVWTPHLTWCGETWWGERTSNGSKKHSSVMGPSVPLMITWLLSDVPRLDGEALQEKQLFINSDRTAAGTWYPSNTQKWLYKWKKVLLVNLCIDRLSLTCWWSKLSFIGFRREDEYNIMVIFFHRSETLTSTPAYKNKHSFTLSSCACKLYFYILVSPCCVTPRSVYQHLTLKRQHNPDWAHSHISAIHYHKNALNMSHNIILNG